MLKPLASSQDVSLYCCILWLPSGLPIPAPRRAFITETPTHSYVSTSRYLRSSTGLLLQLLHNHSSFISFRHSFTTAGERSDSPLWRTNARSLMLARKLQMDQNKQNTYNKGTKEHVCSSISKILFKVTQSTPCHDKVTVGFVRK